MLGVRDFGRKPKALGGEQRLRVFPGDYQEFQGGLLGFPRALFPASNSVGAHIEVLREQGLAGLEPPANSLNFLGRKRFGSRRKMGDAEVDGLTALVRPRVL